MNIALKSFSVIALCSSVSAFAQDPSAEDPPISDPTVESVEIKTQLDSIRGVEEMGLLKQQLAELTQQNQQLMQKLLEATQKIDAMAAEMNSLREGQEETARRRSALPELQLVTQIRTDSMNQAELAAAGRTYRIADGRPFRLMLSNEESLTALPSFLEDGTIEIKIEDLETVQLLAFRPSPPLPSSEGSDESK
ncbi:MAG: hypothetical protein VYE67_16865 [Planctomycetota bacterium]|nr:hypothetical protein [Planctomycetota bacterium]